MKEICSGDVLKKIFKKRDDSAHKGCFGQAVIIGGSKNYVGAPKFAAGSAAVTARCFTEADAFKEQAADIVASGECSMRVGAGTSVLAVPDFLASALYQAVTFSAVYPLSSERGYIRYVESEVDALMRRGTSFAVGMGAGEGETEKIIARLMERGARRIVVDADALYGCKDMDFKGCAALTPHFGEMSRMIGVPISEIEHLYCEIAAEYAKKYNCVMALKCAETCVTDGERIYVNKIRTAKLAKGGSGDVLAGLIAGIAAYHADLFEASVAGCYILSRAAQLAAVNEYSIQATDIIAAIPDVINGCLN